MYCPLKLNFNPNKERVTGSKKPPTQLRTKKIKGHSPRSYNLRELTENPSLYHIYFSNPQVPKTIESELSCQASREQLERDLQ